jgi:cytochrome c biogenesis protein CcmG/thiol:disulfide interchange protein DsbE
MAGPVNEVADEAEGDDDGTVDEAPAGGPRTALVIAVVIGVVAALLVAVLATRDPSTDRVTQSPLLGKLAPAVSGETLDGGTFDLGGQRGRWVVVNFFATWCVPCEVEHPELIDFHERHTAEGDATVVSVLFDDKASTAKDFFEQRGGEWPVVVDPDGGIGVAYGVARVPESFLVAPDGTVVQRLVGGVTAEGLDSLLEQYEARAKEARS